MIGTIYDRLGACVRALLATRDLSMVRDDIDIPGAGLLTVDQLAIRGHPEAMRHFAIEFDRTKYLSRSISEIEFGPRGSIKWNQVAIFQDGKLRQKRDQGESVAISDRIFIEVERYPVIVVRLDAMPEIDPQCPERWRELVRSALDRVKGRA